jgi:hydroxyacylglutathione hydrolase
MGCGRLFEGTAKQMWDSLHLLKQLPKETQLYCAHEYTLSNNKFALTLEPDNLALLQRYQEVKHLRANDKATIPSTLEKELATNPFLREDSLPLQQSIKMTNRSAVEVFKKTRELKDNYKN